MIKSIILITVSIVLFTRCQTTEQRMSSAWLYTHYSGYSDNQKDDFSPASFLLLKDDGSFTCDFGVFEHGRWEYNDHILFLHAEGSSAFPVELKGKELILSKEDGMKLHFESSPVNLKDDNENPFSLGNNQWRIKALQKEADSQLIVRLLNHFRFWETYFAWADKHDIRSIDVRSTATPVKIYGNGFAVKPVEDLPAAWSSVFFDEEDCKRANQIISEQFKKNSISWPRTDNKFKMFTGAFQQLQNNLRRQISL